MSIFSVDGDARQRLLPGDTQASYDTLGGPGPHAGAGDVYHAPRVAAPTGSELGIDDPRDRKLGHRLMDKLAVGVPVVIGVAGAVAALAMLSNPVGFGIGLTVALLAVAYLAFKYFSASQWEQGEAATNTILEVGGQSRENVTALVGTKRDMDASVGELEHEAVILGNDLDRLEEKLARLHGFVVDDGQEIIAQWTAFNAQEMAYLEEAEIALREREDVDGAHDRVSEASNALTELKEACSALQTTLNRLASSAEGPVAGGSEPVRFAAARERFDTVRELAGAITEAANVLQERGAARAEVWEGRLPVDPGATTALVSELDALTARLDASIADCAKRADLELAHLGAQRAVASTEQALRVDTVSRVRRSASVAVLAAPAEVTPVAGIRRDLPAIERLEPDTSGGIGNMMGTGIPMAVATAGAIALVAGVASANPLLIGVGAVAVIGTLLYLGYKTYGALIWRKLVGAVNTLLDIQDRMTQTVDGLDETRSDLRGALEAVASERSRLGAELLEFEEEIAAVARRNAAEGKLLHAEAKELRAVRTQFDGTVASLVDEWGELDSGIDRLQRAAPLLSNNLTNLSAALRSAPLSTEGSGTEEHAASLEGVCDQMAALAEGWPALMAGVARDVTRAAENGAVGAPGGEKAAREHGARREAIAAHRARRDARKLPGTPRAVSGESPTADDADWSKLQQRRARGPVTRAVLAWGPVADHRAVATSLAPGGEAGERFRRHGEIAGHIASRIPESRGRVRPGLWGQMDRTSAWIRSSRLTPTRWRAA